MSFDEKSFLSEEERIAAENFNSTNKVGQSDLSGNFVEQQLPNNENIIENQDTLEVFQKNRLLARAMSQISFQRLKDGSIGLDYRIWDDELDLLQNEGLKFTSCTLLVPGKPVSTYKAYGFLMDADQSEIVHVSPTDSVSGVGSDGFRANTSGLANLDELAEVVKSSDVPGMNEVNAHFVKKSIKALFVNKAFNPNIKMDIMAIQKHLQDKGVDLPTYVYDVEKGDLELWQPSPEEIAQILETEKNPDFRNAYIRDIFPNINNAQQI